MAAAALLTRMSIGSAERLGRLGDDAGPVVLVGEVGDDDGDLACRSGASRAAVSRQAAGEVVVRVERCGR